MKNENIKLLVQLEELLKNHDWYYNMSDDHRYYTSGREQYKVIQQTMEKLNNNNCGVLSKELYDKYKK
jgi:hypothetical protein